MVEIASPECDTELVQGLEEGAADGPLVREAAYGT